MLGFKNFETAKKTTSGIEMIHKGQVEVIQDVLSEVHLISDLMAYAA
jgi:hypothetical protein